MDFVASAVMNKNVTTVPANLSLAELERVFLDEKLSGMPVVDQGKVVGVVSKTDLVRARHPDSGEQSGESWRDQMQTRDIMTPDVVSVTSNDSLHDVATVMYKKRLHRVLVIDDDALVGIITPFDFVRLYSTDRIGTDGRPSNTLDF